MIHVEVDRRNVETIERTLESLAPARLKPIMRSAAKRAMTAGRLAGSKEIQSMYTIKAGIVRQRTRIFNENIGATLKIEGPFEPIKSYKAKKEGRGISVEVKKGAGTLVPRSFQMNSGAFVKRVGAARFPLKSLGGPAVPQLFGKPEVSEAVQNRAMEVYEQRLMHELERLVGA